MDTAVTEKELELACEEFGEIISTKIKKKFGSSQGFGYVQFEKPSEADACIAGLSGQMLGSKAVKVDKFVPKSQRPQRGFKGRYRGGGGGYGDLNMMDMMNFMNMMQMQGGMGMNMGMGMNNPLMMMQNQMNPGMVSFSKLFYNS